ncbi:MAG: hypothetical protein ACKPKO_02580, partial [Candidatus Fonsibacter sp.]
LRYFSMLPRVDIQWPVQHVPSELSGGHGSRKQPLAPECLIDGIRFAASLKSQALVDYALTAAHWIMSATRDV